MQHIAFICVPILQAVFPLKTCHLESAFFYFSKSKCLENIGVFHEFSAWLNLPFAQLQSIPNGQLQKKRKKSMIMNRYGCRLNTENLFGIEVDLVKVME